MDQLDRSNAAYALHCEALELRTAGDVEQAVLKWQQCHTYVGDEPVYLVEYADCLARLGRWDDDYKVASLAVALDPGNAEAWALLGAACGYLGRQEQALRCYDQASRLAPNSPAVMWNRSLYYLLHGRYAEGWRDYEWRFINNQRRRTLKPTWDGSPIPGRTLFVSTEQGIGDTIQFVRFLKRVKAQSQAHVVLEVRRELVSLLHGRDLGVDEICSITAGGSIPYSDFEHVALMSVPFVLGIHSEQEFWNGPYLALDGQRAKGPASIGVCWRGSAINSCDEARSVDTEAFLAAIGGAIADYPDVRCVAVNPACPLPEGPQYINPPDLGSFRDTAERLMDLDLIITVDTAVAHLAGAMGRQVWLLNRYASDWRWCLNHQASTPWYPSMRIFRQPALGDWASVLAEVAGELQKYLKR